MRIKGVPNSVKCGNLQMLQPHYKLSTFLSMQKGHVNICDQLTSAIYLLQVKYMLFFTEKSEKITPVILTQLTVSF